ncbi:MAG: hypothetical protein ACREPD_06135 [Stenotrophomonas sp.]|uniref:hypothetical protein n=1 Tax=Stenotrophomonas sp. TaxID=69392 RepID=UPI003D6D364B
MQPNNPFLRITSAIGSLLDRIGHIWLWFAISLVLLAVVALINPVLVASYIWAASKLTMAAAIGFGVDLTVFRGGDPRHLQDGLEKSMAQTRRVTLIAAAMIAAGLIG